MSEKKPFTLLDEPGLSFYGPKVEGGNKRSRLKIRMVDNNPHMTVYTGIPDDRPIDGNFNTRAFYSALEVIREVAEHNGPIRLMLQNLDHLFIQGQRQQEPSPTSLFACEKKEDGTVVISITAGTKRPFIEFDLAEFGNGQGRVYHFFTDADRNPMPKAIAGKIAARAFVHWAGQYVASWQTNHAAEPKWMVKLRERDGGNFGGGQQQGGYGNRPGGGGGYGQQAPQQPPQSQYQQSAPQQAPAAAPANNQFDMVNGDFY